MMKRVATLLVALAVGYGAGALVFDRPAPTAPEGLHIQLSEGAPPGATHFPTPTPLGPEELAPPPANVPEPRGATRTEALELVRAARARGRWTTEDAEAFRDLRLQLSAAADEAAIQELFGAINRQEIALESDGSPI